MYTAFLELVLIGTVGIGPRAWASETGADLSIPLGPGMPALPEPGVPPLEERVPDADLLKTNVAIEPKQPYRWVGNPGDPFEFTVRGNDSTAEEFVLTVWDWENRPVAQSRWKGPFEQEVGFQVDGRGTYVLTLDGLARDQCLFRQVRSFCICPSNEKKRRLWKRSEFWIGQCSFPGRHDWPSHGGFAHPPGLTAEQSRNLDAELVARMGVPVARIDLRVLCRDQQGFDLDFSQADACVEAFTLRGMDLDLMLHMPYGSEASLILPHYREVASQDWWRYPIQEAPYRHYVREVAKRYGKYARFFQVNNEPSNPLQFAGTPEEYIALVRQSVEEIRRLWPHALITNGGFCNTNDSARKIIAGLRGLTDFISYHYHAGLDGLKLFFAEVDHLHRQAGYSEPRYANTEMGLMAPTVGAERASAAIEVQKILYCWAHGQVGVLLYSSRELEWPRQYQYDGVGDYGFVDHFFCPRFVYGAVSAFLDHYAGVRFERILRESDNLHAYAFRGSGRRQVGLFALREPVRVTLTSNARRAWIVDPMGNSSLAGNAQQVTIQAGTYPQTVVFQGATEVELGG